MKSKLLLGDWFMKPKLLWTGFDSSTTSCTTGFSSLVTAYESAVDVFMNAKPLAVGCTGWLLSF